MQARLREAASLEKHVLLKKLRDALESLRARVAGQNKEEVEEAISMVCLFYNSFKMSFELYNTWSEMFSSGVVLIIMLFFWLCFLLE